jgi:deferrochelatase/peroxidase EfeB
MNSEQIAAIRQTMKDVRAFMDQQEIALEEFKDKTLNPLLKACDHKFPWGESAISDNCLICGRWRLL